MIFYFYFTLTGTSREFCQRFIQRMRKRQGINRKHQQELSLGLTLVGISVLFILCQSVKILPDLYELFCEKSTRSGACLTTNLNEILTRYVT